MLSYSANKDNFEEASGIVAACGWDGIGPWQVMDGGHVG
jgi:hypothetical protein